MLGLLFFTQPNKAVMMSPLCLFRSTAPGTGAELHHLALSGLRDDGKNVLNARGRSKLKRGLHLA